VRVDGFLKEVLVYRNLDEKDYKPFRVTLADKAPEGEVPTFDYVEQIRISPSETEIIVYDLDRPIYYKLPDGTRRKVYYRKKEVK